MKSANSGSLNIHTTASLLQYRSQTGWRYLAFLKKLTFMLSLRKVILQEIFSFKTNRYLQNTGFCFCILYENITFWKNTHLHSILQKKLVTKTSNKGVKCKISIVIYAKLCVFGIHFVLLEIQKCGGRGVISAYLTF